MPNAKKTEVVGVIEDDTDAALKLRLQAPPVEGKANLALIRYLASTLQVPRTAIQITHGELNKRKLVQVSGTDLTPEGVASLLLPVQG